MSSELLTPTEQLNNLEEVTPTEQPLTQVGFEHVLKKREEQLKSISAIISKKLLFTLEKRLSEEKHAVEELLGISKTEQTQKKRYTNILDSQYFEQRLGSE